MMKLPVVPFEDLSPVVGYHFAWSDKPRPRGTPMYVKLGKHWVRAADILHAELGVENGKPRYTVYLVCPLSAYTSIYVDGDGIADVEAFFGAHSAPIPDVMARMEAGTVQHVRG